MRIAPPGTLDSMRQLTTARTVLRPFEREEASELLSLFQDPDVRRYLLDDLIVPLEWVEEEIEASERRFEQQSAGLWSIRLPGDDAIVGFVGFREFFEPPQLQLLYGLLPRVWGRGLATEASERICRLGFDELGFTEILAAIDTPHDASRAVLERLGFRETHRTEGDAPAGTTFFRLDRADASG